MASRIEMPNAPHVAAAGRPSPETTVTLGGVCFIGASDAFLEMCDQLRSVASTDASTLIEGETGTGKELAARAVHYQGARKGGPFIPVNCGAIPDALLESEFFGHRRGAFTDAKESSPGILLLAHGGTLFLDEVDSLSPRAQVALLRFLQDRTVRRVGDSVERTVDVRVLAACSTPLSQLVSRNEFRPDLYYRLHVMHVTLPPLRARAHDVLLLSDNFLMLLSTRYKRPKLDLDTESQRWLLGQTWPGNVRQLENLLEREFLLAEGKPFLRMSALCARRARDEMAHLASEQESWNYRRAKASAVQEFDRHFLERLMRVARGNVTAAARLAGKERRDLGRLLRRYAINPTSFRAES